jgi:hypothetical protein
MEALKLAVYGRPFDCDLRVRMRRLTVAIIAILLDHLPVNLRQVVFPEVWFEILNERAMVSLAAGRESRRMRGQKFLAQFCERQPRAWQADLK